MTKLRFALTILLALLTIPLHLAAQEGAKLNAAKPLTTLKVKVVFTENEGEKKVANLPYTFYVRVGASGSPPWSKIRIGSRVPVYTGKEDSMQYIDVGTNIDARGFSTDDGRFDLTFDLDRSWVEGDVLVPVDKSVNTPADTTGGHFKEPIIRQFRTELSSTMRDGETIQDTQAADPLSGRVFTITITMNVVK